MRAKEFLKEFATSPGFRGDGSDGLISWDHAKALFKKFAEDSLALSYHEENDGNSAVTMWGGELGYPWRSILLHANRYYDHTIIGALLGAHPDGKIDEIKKFVLPMSAAGVDTAVRYYMELRL